MPCHLSAFLPDAFAAPRQGLGFHSWISSWTTSAFSSANQGKQHLPRKRAFQLLSPFLPSTTTTLHCHSFSPNGVVYKQKHHSFTKSLRSKCKFNCWDHAWHTCRGSTARGKLSSGITLWGSSPYNHSRGIVQRWCLSSGEIHEYQAKSEDRGLGGKAHHFFHTGSF